MVVRRVVRVWEVHGESSLLIMSTIMAPSPINTTQSDSYISSQQIFPQVTSGHCCFRLGLARPYPDIRRDTQAEERKTSWRTELLTEKTGLRLVKRMRVVRHLAASLGQERLDWS